MAVEFLSTSYINSLVQSYKQTEISKQINPLNSRKNKYQNLVASYDTLSTKLNSLKSILTALKQTGTDSVFKTKSASSTNASFITAASASTAANSSYELRVNQLAKSDSFVSSDLSASAANAVTGSHIFTIKTGDGSTGEFTSSIEVDFVAGETNSTVFEKIRNAVNSDKAIVQSSFKNSNDLYTGGASSFIINLNGTEHVISVAGGGTYEELVDEIVTSVNSDITGVSAEKVIDGGPARLKLTVADNSKYISISHDSGFDITADLNIGVTKEKSAAGIVSASVFNPDSSTVQFSLASKETGLDFRIKEISDQEGSTALSSVGINIGTARAAFDQSADPDTAGFIYADISSSNQLNSKFTFNGLSFQRNSNSVDNLAAGVTFNLKSVMSAEDKPVNITVNTDASSVKTQIESFISKFNDVYTYIRTKNKSTSGVKGDFWGDANASSIVSYLSSITYSAVPGIPSDELNYLSKIGISFSTSSGLSISDSSLLEKKLLESPSQVESLFNSDNGIANSIYNKISPYLGTEGYLNSSRKSYSSNITYFTDKINSGQARIDKSSDLLRKRYEQLQLQLANLISTQNYFNSSTNY